MRIWIFNRRWLRQWWPLLMLLIGFGTLIFAFLYNVMLVGLPYQDPPPDLQLAYQAQSKIVSYIAWSGIALVISGAIGGLIRIFNRLRRWIHRR